ncbi:hypothetical protein CPB84DRAFT_1685717 [Gymnopilus junonius]|uniref:NADH dehydrogenase [ubiquinone] 1 alpha subcomplex subunit n=1 Tax=Gymnopilus junonius TaxID=109634 RepID=A0A9P5TJU2_GYMJU|nr:hypothetical protein CPB84DRAFT_1685717 [Gymnopilus junonius]
MSFISRLWNSIRNPLRYVGRDLQGNKFYETRSLNDPQRTKRTVQYYDPEDVWKYIGGGKRLAIQWSAWLTHTRKDPPTLEELQADLRRQQRVLANVALIEERDRAEVEERMRIRQEDSHRALEEASARAQGLLEQPTKSLNHALSDSTTSSADAVKQASASQPPGQARRSSTPPPPMPSRPPSETESWTPVTRRRG